MHAMGIGPPQTFRNPTYGKGPRFSPNFRSPRNFFPALRITGGNGDCKRDLVCDKTLCASQAAACGHSEACGSKGLCGAGTKRATASPRTRDVVRFCGAKNRAGVTQTGRLASQRRTPIAPRPSSAARSVGAAFPPPDNAAFTRPTTASRRQIAKSEPAEPSPCSTTSQLASSRPTRTANARSHASETISAKPSRTKARNPAAAVSRSRSRPSSARTGPGSAFSRNAGTHRN